MENHNFSYEPMDIDTSGHSVKEMDISFNDSFPLKTFIKTEKVDPTEEVKLTNNYLNDSFPMKTFFKAEKVDPTEEVKLTNNYLNDSFPMKTVIKAEKVDPIDEVKLTNNNKRPEGQPGIKKFHINMQKPAKNYNNVVFQTLSIGVIILMSIFALHIYSLKCFDEFNIEELRNTLSNKLFGQSDAVNRIMQTLELEERSKLLLFSGGTGVGKTLASSILLETTGPCSNVYHYTMPSFTTTFSTDFMYGLTMCKTSLIIVDDLTVDDMLIKKQIKELTEKSENLGKEIIVILIYNCYESTKEFIKICDESFHRRLLDNFAEIKVLKRLVEFKPLTKTHLKECIKQELGDRTLGDKELEEILKNFNVTVDGCKGVHSKMKYLNIV